MGAAFEKKRYFRDRYMIKNKESLIDFTSLVQLVSTSPCGIFTTIYTTYNFLTSSLNVEGKVAEGFKFSHLPTSECYQSY